MSAAQYQAHLQYAKESIAARDWAEAESQLMQAQVELAGIADGSDRGGSLEMDRNTIERLLADVRRKASQFAASSGRGGIQRARVEYERPEVAS